MKLSHRMSIAAFIMEKSMQVEVKDYLLTIYKIYNFFYWSLQSCGTTQIRELTIQKFDILSGDLYWKFMVETF